MVVSAAVEGVEIHLNKSIFTFKRTQKSLRRLNIPPDIPSGATSLCTPFPSSNRGWNESWWCNAFLIKKELFSNAILAPLFQFNFPDFFLSDRRPLLQIKKLLCKTVFIICFCLSFSLKISCFRFIHLRVNKKSWTLLNFIINIYWDAFSLAFVWEKSSGWGSFFYFFLSSRWKKQESEKEKKKKVEDKYQLFWCLKVEKFHGMFLPTSGTLKFFKRFLFLLPFFGGFFTENV